MNGNEYVNILFIIFSSLAAERDTIEREAREKETRILNQARELEDLRDQLEESNRLRLTQARELEDIMSSKDDVGKNVSMHILCKVTLFQI